MLRLSLDPANRAELPLRTGRAIGWIEDALSPLRDTLSTRELHRLVLVDPRDARHRVLRVAHRHRRAIARRGRRADARLRAHAAARGTLRLDASSFSFSRNAALRSRTGGPAVRTKRERGSAGGSQSLCMEGAAGGTPATAVPFRGTVHTQGGLLGRLVLLIRSNQFGSHPKPTR